MSSENPQMAMPMPEYQQQQGEQYQNSNISAISRPRPSVPGSSASRQRLSIMPLPKGTEETPETTAIQARLFRHSSMLRDKNLSFNAVKDSVNNIPAPVPDIFIENVAPVFEVGYWMNFGNFTSVRQQHEQYKDHVRTLSVWNLPVESPYGADISACLKLGWPRATHVSLEYSTWEPEPNKHSVAWHKILCESEAFPSLVDYRVWQMLPARLEVFSIHKLKTIQERNQATDIIAQVPELLAPTPAVQQFYEHRCRYLEHVVMSMDSMNKAETYTKYKYLTLALATPVLAPRTLTIVNCRLKHIRAILNCIDRNALNLPTAQLQYQPGALELGKGLQHLHLKMASLYDELTGLPISAARFPDLTSLIIEHSPALDNTLPDGEKFGQLWDARWASMKRLQLPFFSDSHAALLLKFMPNLEILAILPAPGFEAGEEYPDTFNASTIVKLVTQLQYLRHFEVRSMLRIKGKKPFNLADQITLALKKPPLASRNELKLLAIPCIHMDFVSVLKLLYYLPSLEQLEFQLPDQFALPPNNSGLKSPQATTKPPNLTIDTGRYNPNVAHNLEGAAWDEEKVKFVEHYKEKHPLASIIITGYHSDLHSASVNEFLGLFKELESLYFRNISREDHDNIDQLAGVLTALYPELEIGIL
ncbi:hypothetical protein GGI12_000415 [Dipsacomyces acuminosporus]|nr:hypothetical protein GGI12_000415 [Dipsacomyces acuminosporus]